MASGTAYAQFGNPYPMRNTAVDTAMQNYVNKSIIDLAVGQSQKGATRAKPVVKHEPASASDFKPSKTRPAVDAFFANTKIDFIDPKDLRAIVDRTFAAVESQSRKHSVASAVGFAVATSLFVARNTNLEDDAVQDLVASINDRLATAASFKKMKAADRQMIYDSMILTTAIIITLNAMGENNESRKADAMEMANEVLVQLGADK